MIGRQKRLNEVYDYLRRYYGIHTQNDFASALNYSRSVISAALNGADKYLTDKLYRNICEIYPEVFNLNYLLTGEGELLASHDVMPGENEKPTNPTIAEPAGFGNLIEIFSRTIRESDDLRVELKKNLAEVKALKDDLHQAVYDFRDATYRLTQALNQLNTNTASDRPLSLAAEDTKKINAL